MDNIRKALNGMKADDAVETILNLFSRTKDNKEFAQNAKQTRIFLRNSCIRHVPVL